MSAWISLTSDEAANLERELARELRPHGQLALLRSIG